MFKREARDGEFIGYSRAAAGAFFFFGSRHCRRADLPRFFPNYRFCFLKQVHGDEVVEASPDFEAAADAHYTSKPGEAVVVQSADCLPLLLAAADRVCAIHAGWRGVEQNIAAAVRRRLPDFAPSTVAIGPHIGLASFKVGTDVAERLLVATPRDAVVPTREADEPNKVFVDLRAIVEAQISALFAGKMQYLNCADDTVATSVFHSFRRDGPRAERQYSFVVLNP